MSDSTPALPSDQLAGGSVTYDDARVVITPEAPHHYEVIVSDADGETSVHAVERVVINSARVALDSSIWFIDVKLDVGVPLGEHGDTVWVWS
jgi:hypothetical protein